MPGCLPALIHFQSATVGAAQRAQILLDPVLPNKRPHLCRHREVLAEIAEVKGVRCRIQPKSGHLILVIDRVCVTESSTERAKINGLAVLPNDSVEGGKADHGIYPATECDPGDHSFGIDVIGGALRDANSRKTAQVCQDAVSPKESVCEEAVNKAEL